MRQIFRVLVGAILPALAVSTGYSQITVPIHVEWNGVVEEQFSDQLKVQYLSYQNRSESEDGVPIFIGQIAVQNEGQISAKIINEQFLPLSFEEISLVKGSPIASSIHVDVNTRRARSQYHVVYEFSPIILQGGVYKRLVSGDLVLTETALKKNSTTGVRYFETNSVLATGSWFKIGLTEPGMYKVTYELIKAMGADMSALSTSTLGLFGNGGKILPFKNDEYRKDDLGENAIQVSDGGDGTFDPGDYFVFYAKGPHQWNYLESSKSFEHVIHQFSDTSYYFITTDRGTGVRVTDRVNAGSSDTTLTTFDHISFYENDLTSLNNSGRVWYGETFNTVTSYDIPFVVPFIDLATDVELQIEVAARTIGKDFESSFNIKANGQNIGVIDVAGVTGDYAGKYAEDESATMTFTPTQSSLNLTIQMDQYGAAIGWLDYIELFARRNLTLSGNQMTFRNAVIDDVTNVGYVMNGASAAMQIWDINDPFNIKRQLYTLNGSQAQFSFAQNDTVHEFVAFNGKEWKTPFKIGRVENQNLHGASPVDYIVITNKLFWEQAQELAVHHQLVDSLTAMVVTDEQIFNEFSSGSRDITAMKDFMKMFYDRAAGDESKMIDYLLLFGDGSYDNKYRTTGNTNFILTYQSSNSLHAIGSYVSDDYFGLLDDDEGERTSDLVDVGIGRLPVSTVEQARNVVKKLKYYGTVPTLGPWRNMVGFVGDDEDSKIHMIQTDLLAEYLDTAVRVLNVDKIYFDAYQQATSAGGDRYPGVTEAIDNRVENGALVLSYIGHGGELGWGHERVLEVGQINGYKNLARLPLFMTATCEFARYDDPERTSAGEFVLLNPNGGGIGLLTTTRLVLSSPNFALATAFNKIAYEPLEDGTMPRLGDLVHRTKLGSPLTINTRNFTLLGDPALRLAYPRYNIVTTSVPDTMKALGIAKVEGMVVNEQGAILEDFNGVVYPTVYDKETIVNTLNNDNIGKFGFGLQKSVIYNGKASVKNGAFEFSFVVPRDISHADGYGKISYYAENRNIDAAGANEEFLITGTDTTLGEDNTGPELDLFLNDDQFIYGGITDENPLLFVKLYDENGINTVGTGIGHDIKMILDGNTAESKVLNGYYESELDSYQNGEVKYRLNDLEEGKHTIKIKAWDVFNNSSESEVEFYVVKESELSLDHVLNYPNPFTTSTAFFFEHNHPNQNLDVRIQVFTVSGKIVRTIDTMVNTEGFRTGPIPWNGKDDFGDAIGRGTYMYKMKVTSPTGQSVEVFEKLVIL